MRAMHKDTFNTTCKRGSRKGSWTGAPRRSVGADAPYAYVPLSAKAKSAFRRRARRGGYASPDKQLHPSPLSSSTHSICQLETTSQDYDSTMDNEALETPQPPRATVTDKSSSAANIVDWDGPDDPQQPLNWSKSKKNVQLTVVSLFTLAA